MNALNYRQELKSLQEQCLTSIAINFDLFYRLFSRSILVNLPASVKILQKLYSNQLLKLLSETNLLKSEHLIWLLNKYSSEVYVQYLINCDPSAIEERLQDIGHVIKVFDMTSIKCFHCDNFLRHLPNPQVLRLGRTNCSDKSLAVLALKCNELKTLDLYSCDRITDKGIKILCESRPPLENLNVEYTSVSYKGVACALKVIPTLTKVMFDNMPRAVLEATGLNDSPLSESTLVLNLSNLVILNNPMRPENHLTAILTSCRKSCPQIQNLVVSEVLTEEQLRIVSTFQKLEVVSLLCSSVVNPKLCVNGFLKVRGEKLTVLSLTSFLLSAELLSQCCPNLISLSLQHPTFEDAENASVSFPCLKVFNLQNASVDIDGNQVTSIISSSPKLEELHIVHCQFSDNVKDVILHCPKKLAVLNFSNTMVSLDFLEEVVRKHSNLERLVLKNSGIDSTDYDDLMDMVDALERKLVISWVDYNEAIRELFSLDDSGLNRVQKKYILKL